MRNSECGIKCVDGRAITDRPYICGRKISVEASSRTTPSVSRKRLPPIRRYTPSQFGIVVQPAKAV